METAGKLVDNDELRDALKENGIGRPSTRAAIIERLELRKPIYRRLAAYGHMGREELGVKWEQTDVAPALRAAAGLQ